ncbi:MAG TPA: UbiA family prenyltransferase [Phycisphaerales bacterium]|nr:UbiA family prenyltransferase [Phycisphaerales bacterium]
MMRLLRPHQWVKSAFVLFGPLYGLRDMAAQGRDTRDALMQGCIAAAVFALASSACYIYNDLRDAPLDRVHPRKRNRPIASGLIGPGVAWAMILALAASAAGLGMLIHPGQRWAFMAFAGFYALNVVCYSAFLKNAVIADVVSLSLGFVLRVLAGCVAVGIAPSTWLLNCTLFLAMFLAFSKRLGERRTAEAGGYEAHEARSVQAKYTDHLLRMSVVVTAVGALLTYAAYVQSREELFAGAAWWGMPAGFNWMWVTLVPATYCLLRSMVLVERGLYDDPTEMVTRDKPLMVAGAVFAAATGAVLWRLAHTG